MKRKVLSWVLAVSLAFTGLPVWAAESKEPAVETVMQAEPQSQGEDAAEKKEAEITASEITAADPEGGTASGTEAADPAADNKAGADAVTDAEAGTGAEAEADTETAAEADTETAAGADTGTTAGADAEAGTEADTETDTETAAGADAEADAEAATVTSTEADTETDTEADTGTAAEADTETDTEAGPETETETDIDTEAGAESESETESDAEAVVCTCGADSDDPRDHDLYCDVFLAAVIKECDCGCGSGLIDDHAEDCIIWTILQSRMEAENGAETFAMTRQPSGTVVSQLAGWKNVSAISGFSSAYRPVKFYPGISSIQPFCSSSDVVMTKTDDGNTFLYPKQKGEEGKFGVWYRKVLYQNHKWYDLKMTVAGYTGSTVCDGGSSVESYPFIVIKEKMMKWYFLQTMGAIALKCEFYASDTGVKEAVNTRFQWWDIDGGQRFGIKNADGSVAGRYYSGQTQVYGMSGQTVAGISGMELLIGPGENAADTDPRYCAAFELDQCSTYYMAFAERDHMDDSDYTHTKTHIQELNERFAAGDAGDIDHNVETLLQTESTLSVIDTPAPVKLVSADGQSWGEECTIRSSSALYDYQVTQFVPWQDTNAYYSSFVIRDELQKGIRYAGNISILREEDGRNVTDSFVVSADGNILMISAKSALLSSADFYGYHYRIRFRAGITPSELAPVKDRLQSLYEVKNAVSLVFRHSAGTAYQTVTSGSVKTKLILTPVVQDSPLKGFDGDAKMTEKILKMQDEEILFTVYQKLPENDPACLPVSVSVEDRLEDCLKFEKAQAEFRPKGQSDYQPVKNWSIIADGQTVKASGAFAPEMNGGELRVLICCSFRKQYDLGGWKSIQSDQGVWITVPNKASVTVSWGSAADQKVTKETNRALLRLREHVIHIVKEIVGEDIVRAHGDPVFTFTVRGTDLNGTEHAYRETLVFSEENSDAQGKQYLSADIRVPAGIYTVTEEKTLRYALTEIRDIKGGKQTGMAAEFDLRDSRDGSAVFVNEKISDEGESHTSFVRNTFG